MTSQLDRYRVLRERFGSLMAAVNTTAQRCTRRPRGLLQRLDILSVRGPASAKREAMMLICAPLLTFGAVVLCTSIAGVAYQPNCNSASNFAANLLFQPKKPSTCESVPFLSDIPTVILSFTCPFALVIYRLLRRRLSSLLEALSKTGLLRDFSLTSELSDGVHKLESSVDLTPLLRALLFAFSAIMTTWLYTRNLAQGHLFNILAKVSPDGSSNAAALRATWWANYHHHFFLAILCVSIGAIGVYYALHAGWLFLRLGVVLFKTNNAGAESLPLSYVPTWRDKSYGWSPVTGALILIYFSTVSFAISMVAVFDMLQNETWTLSVAIFFAALGIVSNLTIILSSFSRMLVAHRAVEKRLQERLSSGLQDDSKRINPEEFMVAAYDLSSWRPVPVSNFSGSVIKIVPGIYAFIQFLRAFFEAKH